MDLKSLRVFLSPSSENLVSQEHLALGYALALLLSLVDENEPRRVTLNTTKRDLLDGSWRSVRKSLGGPGAAN